MSTLKLAVIFGGKSSEYPVSLHSAASLIRSLHKDKYELIFIGISKDGEWFAYDGDVDAIEHDTWMDGNITPCVLSCSTAQKGFLKLKEDGSYETLPVDCIFPVLHGKNGEDGTIQGLFELSGIPYVGCDHMSSAICMDKEMAHIVMENAGIPCAPYLCVYEDEHLDYRHIYEEAKAKLGLPIFIKPANAGSSFGIHKIASFDDFEESMKDAFYHDGRGKVILETTIEGFEIGCAVLGNHELIVGECDEIDTKNSFFDFAAKYALENTQIHCSARISKALSDEAKQIAKKAYRTLNCSGMCRVDMFINSRQKIIFNEVNTIPGFTATSRYPSMMKAAGIGFGELIDRLVQLALEI